MGRGVEAREEEVLGLETNGGVPGRWRERGKEVRLWACRVMGGG
jgi:hypothetical protein